MEGLRRVAAVTLGVLSIAWILFCIHLVTSDTISQWVFWQHVTLSGEYGDGALSGTALRIIMFVVIVALPYVALAVLGGAVGAIVWVAQGFARR